MSRIYGRSGIGRKFVLQAAVVMLLLAGLLVPVTTVEAGSPIANVGGPYSSDEGQQITFTGDATDSEDATNLLTFEWDFEFDGSFSAAQSGVNLTSPVYTYGDVRFTAGLVSGASLYCKQR